MENQARVPGSDQNDATAENIELYDDMAPASPPRPASLRTMFLSAVLTEVNNTIEEINKALAVLGDIDRQTAPRETLSGERISSTLAESLLVRLRRSGLDESLREQFSRLQSSAARANLEQTLRQYWKALRERSERLRLMISQQRDIPTGPQEYNPTPPPAPAPRGFTFRRPLTKARPKSGSEPEQAPGPEYPASETASAARELHFDTFDESSSGEIVLVAEHPGLQPDSLRLSFAHDIVVLSVLDLQNWLYTQEYLLPSPVQQHDYSLSYRNGVLEIRLKKQAG